MVNQHYRWDFIGLSTDTKPTSQTSEKVVNGSTFYCSDNSKLYVYCDGTWYERQPLGGGGTTYTDFIGTDGVTAGEAGLVPAPATTDVDKFLKSDGTWSEAGGGGPTVVQSTGSSTTDVMSQDAVTKELFYNHNRDNVQIGSNANAQNSYFPTVSIGQNSKAVGNNSVSVGISTSSDSSSTVAIGNQAHSYNQGCITMGNSAWAEKKGSIAIGGYSGSSDNAMALKDGSIALGLGSYANVVGEFNIGERTGNYGYNNSSYRLLTGLYDGQNAHDAVTVEQVNGLIDAINTALNVNIPHIGAAS